MEERARTMVQQAEAAKARMYEVSGKDLNFNNEKNANNPLLHSVMVYEEYAVIRIHVDELFKKKIQSGDYVDFAKLLLKDRVSVEQDK